MYDVVSTKEHNDILKDDNNSGDEVQELEEHVRVPQELSADCIVCHICYGASLKFVI